MKAAFVAAAVAGIGTFCALLAATLLWRVEVRHSAPYGFSKTIDFDRLIAVPGGYVTANYPDFDRLDLDIRAYDTAAQYDLTVHIRPAVAGAGDIRTVRLDIDGARVPYAKGTFGNPFTTVRFPPISDSVGQTYYVWLERGPRNREEVVTLWSIKSYSSVPARSVLAATLNRIGAAWGQAWLKPTALVLAIWLAALCSLVSAGLVWHGWQATFGASTRTEP